MIDFTNPKKKYLDLSTWSITTSLILGYLIAFCLSWTYTYDIATPVGTDAPSVLDDRDRETKAAVQERLNVEHVFDLTGTQVSGANTGKHTDITCTSVTSTGALSGTTIAGSGDFAVNTSKFKVTAASGNTVVAGTLDVAGTFESTGVATLGDGSLLKTSAAPTTDAMIANKKYVDDNTGSANYTPSSYTGGESVTFPNGMIMKTGTDTYGSGSESKTFAVSFPNSFESICVTPANAVASFSLNVTAASRGGFTVFSGSSSINNFYWMAIGY